MRSAVLTILLVLVLSGSSVDSAQEEGELVVGIVLDENLNALSISDHEGNGIRGLARIFQSFGADVRGINLQSPIDDAIDVVVLVRPHRPLNRSQIARLWLHVEQGKHLLLALDPPNYADVGISERSGRGISRLLEYDYGIGLQDNLLVENWFTTDSIDPIEGSQLMVYAEDMVAHPIIDPLLEHQLPVHIWGGRSLDIEPFVPDAEASPLIYTETAYGESSNNPDTLTLNISEDFQGRLLVGAVGENSASGGRLVILGDSEMLQDAYGLSLITGSTNPHFAGNTLLTQRMVAWLLGVPEAEWPVLSNAYTQLVIDGYSDDWTDNNKVEALINDQFLYLLIETNEAPDPQLQVGIALSNGPETQPFVRIDAQNGAFVSGADTPVLDAAIAIAEVIEVRLPLRLFERNGGISSVCLFNPQAPETPLQCFEDIALVDTGQFDPIPVRVKQGPLATIVTNGPANLLAEPKGNAPIMGVVQTGAIFAAAGRTEDADWVWLENGRFGGWLEAFLVELTIDIEMLPVIE